MQINRLHKILLQAHRTSAIVNSRFMLFFKVSIFCKRFVSATMIVGNCYVLSVGLNLSIVR